MGCAIKIKANGKDSELQVKLAKALNSEERARATMEKISGTDFKKRFGDWESAGETGVIPSELAGRMLNLEPQLHKKKGTNQYYFELPGNVKFFINRKKMNDIPTQHHSEIILTLSKNYLASLKDQNNNTSKRSPEEVADSIDKTIAEYMLNIQDSNDIQEVKDFRIDRANTVLRYKDDFVKEVITFVEDITGNYSSREYEGTIAEEGGTSEDDRGNNLGIGDSFEVNPLNSASTNVKIMLSQIEQVDEDGIALEGSYLGLSTFVELNEAYKTLLPALSDVVGYGNGELVVDVFDVMKERLKLVKGINWMESFIETLDGLSVDKKTEFVQAFSLAKINFYATEVDGKKYKVINATSTNSRESQIVARWGNRFQNDFIKEGKITAEKKEELDAISLQWKKAYSQYDTDYKAAKKDTDLENDANDAAMISFIEMVTKLGVFTEIDGISQNIDLGVTDLYLEMNGTEEEKRNLIRGLFDSTKRIVADLKNPKNSVISKDGVFNNPLANQKDFVNLAKTIAVGSTDIADSNILANGGKSYYTYANPTYLSNKINEWKEDIRSKADDFTVPTLLEELGQDSYTDNSRWRIFLSAANITDKAERRKKSLERIEAFEQGLASTFKSRGLNDGSDNKDIDYVDAINDSFNKLLAESIKGKSYFPTLLAADKGRKAEFTGLEMMKTKIQQNPKTGEILIPKSTISLFTGYFTDEYNRMKKVARELSSLPESELVVHYHTGAVNGLQSQLFPEFSANSNSDNFKALRESLYDSNGLPLTTAKGISEAQMVLLREAIKETLQERVQETADELNKITNKNEAIEKYYDAEYNNTGGIAVAGDYLVNGLISTIEYGKLFSGDPAYYKNTVDLIKRIPATYTDGQYLRITDADSLIFNQATVEGVEVTSRYIDKIKDSLTDKSIADAYEVDKDDRGGVNTTDAQAWITPRRWKFIKQRLGQWGPVHKSAFAAMESGRKMSEAELKVSAQPLKGVYFDMQNNGRPVYLKYSQAVLLPNLVKGTPMEALYNKMVGETTYDPRTKKTTYARNAKDEIHEVVTIDGVKVGAVAPTRINEPGTTNLKSEFKLNAVQLSNRGWKLQQQLPTKKIHETNLGSQVQRTILSGMVMKGDYVMDGAPIKGKELLKKFHAKVTELSNLGKERLTNKFDIVDGQIQDMGALYDALIEDLRSTGGNSNIIQALEKETDFDAIPQIKSKVQSLFMAMMNKEVVKISTNGGSFIQVSPFALESVNSEQNAGIKIVSNNYDGKGLQPPRMSEDGKTVLPGQVMMPHTDAAKLLKKLKLDITKMTGAEIMEVLDPSVLEVMGYRIPNQGMSSNDYLEIVGILPEGMGDSMLVYDAIPGKTGSDFDIDKMFLMMNNIEIVDGKITKTQNESSIEYKQNEMIALYKSVLSSPLTYDAMMTSIDGTQIKDDINFLFPKKELGNLELFSPMHQTKAKFEYASGAAGLGQVANQLIDHVAGQSLNLGLLMYLGQGTFRTNSKGQKYTTFDKVTDGSISNTLSAFLNAYVDIAKDPYISRGNHNSVTSSVGLMLVRAGYDIKWINRFLGQPILKELVKITKDSEGKTAEPLRNSDGRRVTPMEKLIADKDLSPIGIPEGPEFTEAELESKIFEARTEGYASDKEFDSKILSTFSQMNDMARKLSSSIQASKPAVNGAGGSSMERLIAENKIASVMADKMGLVGFASKFKDTALGAYTDNSVYWIGDVLNNSNLFMAGTKDMDKTFNSASDLAGKGEFLLNPDFARVLDKSFYSYIISGTEAFSAKGTKENEFQDLIVNLPIAAKQARETNDTNNFFLSELQFNISKDGYEFISIDSKNKPKHYQDKIYNDWLSLYENEDTKELSVQLVKYAFATSGFANNLGQFFSHIPHEILQDLNLPRDIVKAKREIGELAFDYDENYVDQTMRNNADDPKVVKRISLKQDDVYNHKEYNQEQAFTLAQDLGDESKPIKYITTRTKKGEILLYEYAGVDKGDVYATFAENGQQPLVYARVSKLGHKSSKGAIVEYAKGEKYGQSTIPQNQLNDDMVAVSGKIFSMYRNLFQSRPTAVKNETETKLEFGDLFSQKDVSLSNKDIIKNNLDQIVIDNNIKENKDC
tara:strand:+ start:2801 stop:9094 length:6294 start_codon:yes stop_codon:yes gene_type:complete